VRFYNHGQNSVYARRWRIENKLVEPVDFFHLNTLSSPIMIRIFFDLLLSVIASLLYRRFAQDLPRLEKEPIEITWLEGRKLKIIYTA